MIPTRAAIFRCAGWILLALPLLLGRAAEAQIPPTTNSAVETFNAEAAARSYLSRPNEQAKARSDAYFEGGYWIQVWQFLYGAGISVMLLQTRVSTRLRQLASRCTRRRTIHTVVYAALYVVLTTLMALPLSIYTDFLREHHYGLATQTFGGWLRDWMVGLLVGIVMGAVLMVALFSVVRRLPNTWHIWGAAVSTALFAILLVVSPVFIAPLFNQYKPLDRPEVVQPILSMARANGIPANEVFQVDASRQSKRVSANVSGLLGTMRISLNDNLLSRCSLAEIQAVMGHEMGHYVLNHIYKMLLFWAVVIAVGFMLLRSVLERLLARRGSRWEVEGPTDLAAVPLVVLLFSTYFFLLTPITNSYTRSQEMEADMFGLNASRQPDGFAEVTLKLGEYRKLEPGPLEEWLFYDHPSGATRIRAAMRWKAEHLRDTP